MNNDRYYTVKEVNTMKAFRKVFKSKSFKDIMNDKFRDLFIFGSSKIHEDELKVFKEEIEREIKTPNHANL